MTGGSGQIGRHLLAGLGAAHTVVNADLVPGGDADEFAECDVLDIEAVRRAVSGARAVCHLAGLDYDLGASDEDYVRVNAVGTWNVLQAAAEQGASKVILASSSSAYGLFDEGAEPPRFLPVDESHPKRPREGYSLSKLVVEEMAATWARRAALDVVCLQPLHVVGPDSVDRFERFLASAPSWWPHNYVMVHDVARAFRLALATALPGCSSILIGAADTPLSEPTLSWYAERIGELPELRDRRRYEANPRASLFSTDRARDLLGWEPVARLAELTP